MCPLSWPESLFIALWNADYHIYLIETLQGLEKVTCYLRLSNTRSPGSGDNWKQLGMSKTWVFLASNHCNTKGSDSEGVWDWATQWSIHQRADRMETTITESYPNSPLGSQPCLTHETEPCHVEFWQNVVHGRRKWQTTSVFLPWEPHEQYEKAKR